MKTLIAAIAFIAFSVSATASDTLPVKKTKSGLKRIPTAMQIVTEYCPVKGTNEEWARAEDLRIAARDAAAPTVEEFFARARALNAASMVASAE